MVSELPKSPVTGRWPGSGSPHSLLPVDDSEQPVCVITRSLPGSTQEDYGLSEGHKAPLQPLGQQEGPSVSEALPRHWTSQPLLRQLAVYVRGLGLRTSCPGLYGREAADRPWVDNVAIHSLLCSSLPTPTSAEGSEQNRNSESRREKGPFGRAWCSAGLLAACRVETSAQGNMNFCCLTCLSL